MAEDSQVINLETVSNPDMLAGILQGLGKELMAMIVTVNELVIDHSLLVQARDGNVANASSLGKMMLSAQSVFVHADYQSTVSGAIDASTFASADIAVAGPSQLAASEIITTDIDLGLETAANPELLRVTIERMGTQISMVKLTLDELNTDHALAASGQQSLALGASSLGSCYHSYQVLIQASAAIEAPCPSQFDASTFTSNVWNQGSPADLTGASVITRMTTQGN